MKSFAFRIFIFFLFIPSPAQSQEHGIPASLAADFIHAVIEAGPDHLLQEGGGTFNPARRYHHF